MSRPAVAAMLARRRTELPPPSCYYADADGTFPVREARQHLGGGVPVSVDEARTHWREWLDADGDAPAALYVHIPFCRHRCAFCPFYINRRQPNYSREYTDLLLKELALTVSGKPRLLRAVYLGGGTPSDLEDADLARLLAALREAWHWDERCEVTVEARLRGFTADKARACVAAGANRFSLGVQTTDTRLRRSLGRLADREELLRVLRDTAVPGAQLAVDLLYGLPGQTPAMVEEDIRLIAEETPVAAVTFYELINFPNSPLHQAVAQGRLPPLPVTAQLAELYRAGRDALARYGFTRHTLVHWRRADDDAVYNQHVKTGGDIIPLGSGAGGIVSGRQVLLSRALADYQRLITSGEKPITHAFQLNPAQHHFQSTVSAALEHRHLPPELFAILPAPAHDYLADLHRQWQTAALLTADHHLTPSGEFWANTMEKHLFTAAGHFMLKD